ncbi:uncharacterized protein DEA37_0001910 [Paragonimus westermani]|uniref:Uncharacterized protein n=1 Tax=Paragonimus westermani TaxID=34504 RepID=A0A5J4NN86_9TREM|nr:uncharacterized protein DEA37_0001910 [Paragonimus westermani]
MPAIRLPHRALFADTPDSQSRWLETLGEMAADRVQWHECCRCLSELSVKWELHPTSSNPNPTDNRPAYESSAICSTSVCLPLDVRVLGRSAVRIHPVDEFVSSNDSSSPLSKSLFVPHDVPTARRSLLSFVHVASSAQSALMHAREIQRQLDQDTGQSDLSIASPINKSRCSTFVATVDTKTPTKHTSNGSVRSETSDDRRTWSNQLLCIVTGLLAHVFSTAHEQVLHRLIQAAQRSQSERNDVCPSLSEKPLFDACVYTRIARLLATYTFPLEARMKIQSALLGLEIRELFTDAKTAVSELEKAVRLHPGLAEVDQGISPNSAISLQRPQNFHTLS